jgi:hypothetical protein
MTDKWRELHPDWELRLWRDEDLRWLENQELFDQAERYVPVDAVGQLRADIARYEILHRYGGIYVDVDVEPLKPFDEFLDNVAFAGWERDSDWVGNTVLGAEPGAEFFRLLIDALPDSVKKGNSHATYISGPRFLTPIFRRNLNLLKVYPSKFFYPYSHREIGQGMDPAYRSYPEAFSVHHWAHKRKARNVPLSGLPLRNPSSIKISWAIMAHEKRRDWVPGLLEQMPEGTQVIWDRVNDRHETGLRAIAAFDPEADYHVIVQDDAVLCEDFEEAVRLVLSRVDEGAPVSLYLGSSRFYNTLLKIEKPSYMVGDGPIWGVGIALPVPSIPDVMEYFEAATIENYDRRIMYYYQSVGVKCWYPVPSPVDHRTTDNPSLAGHSRLNRHAWRFAGPWSSTGVDWYGKILRV